MPSTWVKCTMGGFFCGGSGGIGSITWGGINAPGNVKSVTMMTCEEEPRLVRLEEAESLQGAPHLRHDGAHGGGRDAPRRPRSTTTS